MNEKTFLKTSDVVKDILESEPITRDCDLFLIWEYWKTKEVNLDVLTMAQFKQRFLEGRLGLPETVTRARRNIQKLTPELASITKASQRKNRAEFWRVWFGVDMTARTSTDIGTVKNIEIASYTSPGFKEYNVFNRPSGFYSVTEYIEQSTINERDFNIESLADLAHELEKEAILLTANNQGADLHRIRSGAAGKLFESTFKKPVLDQATGILLEKISQPAEDMLKVYLILDNEIHEKIKAGIIEEVYIEKNGPIAKDLLYIDVNRLLIELDQVDPGHQITRKVKYITQGLGRSDWGAKQGVNYHVLGIEKTNYKN